MEQTTFINAEIRAFDRKKAEESRTVEFVISDNTRDRHGTIIPVDNWQLDNFNKNGISSYQHNASGYSDDPDMILGPARAWKEEGKLIGEITFETKDVNPLAEKIFQKVLNGTLKATSVGFREITKGNWVVKEDAEVKESTYVFGQVELLEFSIVNIPSNPNALRRSHEIEDKTAELTAEIERLGAQIISMGKQIEFLKKAIEYYKKSRRG